MRTSELFAIVGSPGPCNHLCLLAYAFYYASMRSYCTWSFGLSFFQTGFGLYGDKFASNPFSSARRMSSSLPYLF